MDRLVLALYFTPPLGQVDALLAIKRGVALVGCYQGEPFQPSGGQREAYDRSDPEALNGGLLLTHGPLAYEAGRRTWSLVLDHRRHEDRGLSVLRCEAPLVPLDAEGARRAWRVCLHVAPRLVTATQPSFACLCGVDASQPDDQTPYRPSAAELHHFELPPFFTPWVYIGPDRLTEEKREALAALPCPVTRPLGEGWVVQAVPHLHARPEPALLDALARLPSWAPVGYRQAEAPG